jgi:DNA-directed RNA polymerase subunit RPC12/RpoP
MNHPHLICENCGSENLRRSRRRSLSEFRRMAFGDYPFRCVDCGHRSWINVLLLSKLKYAKCPRCMSLKVTRCTSKSLHLSFTNELRLSAGARLYRCTLCHHPFASFLRPFEPASQQRFAESPSSSDARSPA